MSDSPDSAARAIPERKTLTELIHAEIKAKAAQEWATLNPQMEQVTKHLQATAPIKPRQEASSLKPRTLGTILTEWISLGVTFMLAVGVVTLVATALLVSSFETSSDWFKLEYGATATTVFKVIGWCIQGFLTIAFIAAGVVGRSWLNPRRENTTR